MIGQLRILFDAMVDSVNANTGTNSPLVRSGLAIINQSPDVNTSQMPLSVFNVFLSENHGDTVTVCIADTGKTIYGSYADENFEQITNDQSALQAALSGVSTKNRPGAENRGYGISTSADMIVRGMDSTLIILSGRGLLFYDGRRSDFTELPESIFMPGALVCFTMPTHKDGFNYNYIGG